MYICTQEMNEKMHFMNNIGFSIRKVREEKGLSQDYMAAQLDISQASYARIENEETKITVARLYKIAEVLKTDITDFFNGSKLNIQTQNNNEGSYGNGYVQNLHIENKEVYEKLIKSKDEQIALLKSLLEDRK